MTSSHSKAQPSDGIIPTKLYCHNSDVDAENNRRLGELSGAPATFRAKDTIESLGGGGGSAVKQLSAHAEKYLVPAKLRLKVGAQVVLLQNKDLRHGLANGTRGVVVSIANATSKDGKHDNIPTPKVRFDNGRTLNMFPSEFKCSKGPNGGSITRAQVPLKLAWASTVHKSQGMTLSRVEVAISKAFDPGQVYVALSRCVSLAGLWINGPILRHRIKAHAAVKAFEANE